MVFQNSFYFSHKLPARCVVAGCSNNPDNEKSRALHPIPFIGEETTEGRRRKKKWVDFVNLKQARWIPTKWSCICSMHFTPESFTRGYPATHSTPRLVKDEIGVVPYPTIHLHAEEASPRKKGTVTKEKA